jgi:phosphatidylglycerophosphatase A
MIKIINISILSMLAIGRSKYAPGTVASFVTALIFILFFNFKFNIIYIIICVSLIFVYSVYTIDSYIGYFDEIDSREIVIDEFVGQSIPILIAYSFIPKNDIDNFVFYTLLSFATFRLFDITKPYPINKIDKYMKNGFGVMLDDVIAGIYSSVILLLVVLFVGYE